MIRTGFLPRDFPGKPRGGGGHAQLLTGVEEEAKGGSSVLWGQMDGRKWFHQGAGRVRQHGFALCSHHFSMAEALVSKPHVDFQRLIGDVSSPCHT